LHLEFDLVYAQLVEDDGRILGRGRIGLRFGKPVNKLLSVTPEFVCGSHRGTRFARIEFVGRHVLSPLAPTEAGIAA